MKYDPEVFYRKCPRCGDWALDLGRNFKPPKSSDKAQWAKVEFLVQHGFVFQKIYREADGGFLQVRYPETLAEAKEFVEHYADQAWNVPPPPPNDEPAA